MARATLTIDLDAIAANWRALDALSAASVETGAVVKADAYGLGIARVAPALAAAGARSFFVALAEEGAELRRILGAGPSIHIFSGHMPGDAPLLAAHDLIPLLNSVRQVKRHRQALPGRAYGLQLNSGMNRLGIEPGAVPPGLAPVLTISHLACADTPHHPENARQRAAFAPEGRASLAATGGTLLGAEFHCDLTRPGIGLYGGYPFTAARPVVALDLPVIQTRTIAAGETVGYGATWRATRPSRIATVSAGYADGLIRAMGNRACLFHGTTACPLVGRVSMDVITVDITDTADRPESLSILGPQQRIDTLAEAAGTIGYEILTSLGTRYNRVYKGG
ncbi:alanine racemase [Algicella marina]|uniref:Alanine racemase n=1 Tax=Algicella marina TaxID=2683284 RepID=A0A6P1SVX3_9RHOB|nr:alanine racemase [Algicella marina]QHQ34824.1 alanine racemase [Algicella marina]